MKDQYALITGSSSGIGLAFAKELAHQKLNIILHGRNELSLKKIQQEIIKDFGVKCDYVILDLSKDIKKSDLESLFSKYTISTFISNAGLGVAGFFHETDIDVEIDLALLHVNSVMILTKYFLDIFKRQGSGSILNVSSLYSFFPVPKQSVYGATKAFQHSFFLALHKEMQINYPQIRISSVCPGLTYTNFRIRQGKTEKKSLVAMTPKEVCHIALRGLSNNNPEIIPGIFCKIMAFIIPKLPRSLALSIIYNMNKQRGF